MIRLSSALPGDQKLFMVKFVSVAVADFRRPCPRVMAKFGEIEAAMSRDGQAARMARAGRLVTTWLSRSARPPISRKHEVDRAALVDVDIWLRHGNHDAVA